MTTRERNAYPGVVFSLPALKDRNQIPINSEGKVGKGGLSSLRSSCATVRPSIEAGNP